ncbi:MAG TPA: threonylcarbamoyl-AMP synthase [Bdellovibrionales bacterium]|nr:threonylcarbamoyl-AMP synthase [Bdellovibrionales bacterium]HCM38749.1 threonylcarbamoyl-AMP synthase [Bdellovibrionales bacterium]
MEEVWKLISKTRKTRMMQPTAEEIRLAANALRADELVAMPTETVYGLAGNAFSTEALTRIFSSKERPTFDPLIIHVPEAWNSLEELESNGLIDLETMNPLARERASKLIAAFWPGPLTLVLPKTSKVPDLATSGLQTVAIRMPAHPVAQKLLSEAGIPLAAPSANRFGRISPTSAQDVAAELGGRISWILDGGRCEIGLESTVLAVSNEGELQLLRPGRITAADIQKVTQAVTIPAEQITLAGPTGTAAASPGLLKSHYAPKKPLYILNSSVSSPGFKLDRKDFGLAPDTRIGILVMSGDSAQIKARLQPLLGEALEVRSLSRDGSFEKIARNLFAELRALDDSAAQVLFAEPCASEEGLGFAIADRLKRASSR